MKDRIEKGSFRTENSQIWLVNKTRTEGSCSGLFSQILRFHLVSMIQFCPFTAFIQGFLTGGLPV